LLENEYDIRTIQLLLRHVSMETTMIYTHVAHKNFMGVRSPLDNREFRLRLLRMYTKKPIKKPARRGGIKFMTGATGLG
jgi:hypothetical protein